MERNAFVFQFAGLIGGKGFLKMKCGFVDFGFGNQISDIIRIRRPSRLNGFPVIRFKVKAQPCGNQCFSHPRSRAGDKNPPDLFCHNPIV